MQNLMAQKLFQRLCNNILTQITLYLSLLVSLLFSGLYLPAHAAEANKATPAIVKPETRKSPEANFIDGNTCLEQSNIACATLALANIPSLSPYAKLLQGSIALKEHRIDDAIRLLLPLQAEKNLNTEASIYLHRQLATSFESLDDVPQAAAHLLQANSLITESSLPDAQIKIDTIHQKIWALLNKQDQSLLISMRGDNTDHDFQGWLDLCLAAKNQDIATSLANWATSYPDHSAVAFAKTLTQNITLTQSKFSLPDNANIALILPLTDEANIIKADAFKQGLEAALSKYKALNVIKNYASTGSQESITEQYTLAKNEGAAYFIAPNFNRTPNEPALIANPNEGNILHVGLWIDDEAKQVVTFANSHAIQHILILATDDASAKQMTDSFSAAWQANLGTNEQSDYITIVALPQDTIVNEAKLFDLKTQIASNNHDMLLLAMSAADAHIIKPYLNISTPTLAFSAINNTPLHNSTLNALRFVDIPFLTTPNNTAFTEYKNASAHLNSNELLRWFALGVDTAQLLMASTQANGNEIIINGLTGELTLDKTGTINRRLSIARFTFNGIELESDH
jgi:uncharacterized protein